jgi:hypothetical protein
MENIDVCYTGITFAPIEANNNVSDKAILAKKNVKSAHV